MLQFARQNGCEWGPDVCSVAAEHGNLSILKWLRQHGCPWDYWTNVYAAVNDHFEVLKWAVKQQPPCPWWHRPILQSPNMRPCVLVYLSSKHL